MENTPEAILEQLKKNEAYLASIAANQEQILNIEQKRLATERMAMFSGWVKIIAIVLITWISFVAAQKMITGLTSSMGGILGGGSNIEVNGAQDLTKQLQSSQDLIKELLGN